MLAHVHVYMYWQSLRAQHGEVILVLESKPFRRVKDFTCSRRGLAFFVLSGNARFGVYARTTRRPGEVSWCAGRSETTMYARFKV